MSIDGMLTPIGKLKASQRSDRLGVGGLGKGSDCTWTASSSSSSRTAPRLSRVLLPESLSPSTLGPAEWSQTTIGGTSGKCRARSGQFSAERSSSWSSQELQLDENLASSLDCRGSRTVGPGVLESSPRRKDKVDAAPRQSYAEERAMSAMLNRLEDVDVVQKSVG